MLSIEDYLNDSKDSEEKYKHSLLGLIDRCKDPTTAKLSKDEAITVMIAFVRGDCGNLVPRSLESWQLISSVWRAKQ